MKTFFKFSAASLMVLSAAGLVAIFRAPFTWRLRLMFGTVQALAIYFGWLSIRVSKLIAWPDESAGSGRDYSLLVRDPIVRRAIWVLLGTGGLLIVAIILGITGVLD